jgi:Rrf2 family protein
MEKFTNITDKTNIVIHSLAFICAKQNIMESVPAKFIAKELNVSETYLAKVLQPIVKENILSSSRGTKGGYSLQKNSEKIKIIDIFTMLEGKIPDNHCLFNKPVCKVKSCPFHEISIEFKKIFLEKLSGKTILDLSENFR